MKETPLPGTPRELGAALEAGAARFRLPSGSLFMAALGRPDVDALEEATRRGWLLLDGSTSKSTAVIWIEWCDRDGRPFLCVTQQRGWTALLELRIRGSLEASQRQHIARILKLVGAKETEISPRTVEAQIPRNTAADVAELIMSEAAGGLGRLKGQEKKRKR